jgi:transposase-like protein
MKRPDLATLACVNPACHLLGRTHEGHLTVRQVSGHDQSRLLRCRLCGGEFSERRGSALCNTKLPEAPAEEVSTHRGAGCSVRATARLVKVCKETVARLWRVSGRHAARLPDQPVRDRRPLAVEFDAPWSLGQKSQNAAPRMSGVKRATGGIIPPWRLTAS